jgi:hypothetical protein
MQKLQVVRVKIHIGPPNAIDGSYTLNIDQSHCNTCLFEDAKLANVLQACQLTDSLQAQMCGNRIVGTQCSES